MRKLVKLILLCLIAYPIISIVSSCSEEEDCSMNAHPTNMISELFVGRDIIVACRNWHVRKTF